MAIFDLFSKRQKQLRGEIPDVYQYDNIPEKLRVQVVHIWNDFLFNNYEHHKVLVNILRREYGVFRLIDERYYRMNEVRTSFDDERDDNVKEELVAFLLNEKDTEKVLDVIELSFRVANDDAIIAELNARFKEHGIGFEYSNGKILRIDSQLIHSEVVKPALSLLSEKEYAGVQQEFLKAYEHYRQGNHKEALNEALKAFESTMKVICNKRGWSSLPTDTSKKLIEICYQNKLVPDFWQTEMSGLRSLLESGVPTGRNQLSGHGQGVVPIEVPEHIVSYVLHMTASAIVFLVKAEQDL